MTEKEHLENSENIVDNEARESKPRPTCTSFGGRGWLNEDSRCWCWS